MADLIQFDIGSGGRIANVVRLVEQTPRRARALTYTPILSQERGGGGGARLCKTLCEFPKNSISTVEVFENGVPPNETSSGEVIEDVVNKYADVAAGVFVSIARHGNGRWYVISAECG